MAEPGGNGVLIGGNEEARRRAWLRQSKHKTKRPKRIEHTQSLYLIYHTHTQSPLPFPESTATSYNLYCRDTNRDREDAEVSELLLKRLLRRRQVY